MFLWIVASFFLCESPRWLFLSHQDQGAVKTLIRLRCLPFDHPRVQQELRSIKESLQSETEACEVDDHSPSKIISIARETFTVLSNLRRLQQALILYALPQLSGGNSVTNYFIPILEIVGLAGNSTRNLFLNGMYTLSKFFFSLFASFFFIDALGRRNSLFVGVALQMISDIYLAVYIKVQQDGPVSYGASEAALASIFIHSFGYTIGESPGEPESMDNITINICAQVFSLSHTSLVGSCGPTESDHLAPHCHRLFTGYFTMPWHLPCRHFYREPITGAHLFSSQLGARLLFYTCTSWYQRSQGSPWKRLTAFLMGHGKSSAGDPRSDKVT